jgi:hypothetical protein
LSGNEKQNILPNPIISIAGTLLYGARLLFASRAHALGVFQKKLSPFTTLVYKGIAAI